jgi:hypothetical protein
MCGSWAAWEEQWAEERRKKELAKQRRLMRRIEADTQARKQREADAIKAAAVAEAEAIVTRPITVFGRVINVAVVA